MKTSVNKNIWEIRCQNKRIAFNSCQNEKKGEKSREIVVLLFNRKNVATKGVCKAKKQVHTLVLARQASIKE